MKFKIEMYGYTVNTDDETVYTLLTFLDNEVAQLKRMLRALLDLRALEKDKR